MDVQNSFDTYWYYMDSPTFHVWYVSMFLLATIRIDG